MIFSEKNTALSSNTVTKLSIRTIIIAVFLAQVIIVAFFIAYLSMKGNAKSINELVGKLFNEMNASIQNRIIELFKPPVVINNINEILIRNHLLDDTSQNALLKHFHLQLLNRDTVTGISYGSKAGGGVYAGREGTSNKFFVCLSNSFQSGAHRMHAIDEKGTIGQLITSVPFFDACSRPWYKIAEKDSGVVWSDIYIDIGTKDLMITASKAVRDKNGELSGVVSVDLSLFALSNYLEKLIHGTAGQMFIVDKTGLLVASSNKDMLFTIDSQNQVQERINVTQSDSKLIQMVSNKIKGSKVDFRDITHSTDLSVSVNNTPYFVHVKPYSIIPSQNWLIITAVPKTTYLSSVYANNRATFYLVFITFFISVLIAIALARMISKPILMLDKKVKAFSQNNWIAETVPSGIKEIDHLVTEISIMKSTIQSNIDSLNNEITERKHAEFILEHIIDENPISILVVDKDGFTIKANAACVKLFGSLPPPDFSVFDDFSIKHLGLEEELQRLKNGEVIYLPEIYYNGHDYTPGLPDKPVWIKVVIFPIIGIDGKPERFVHMHDDISTQKNVEKALIAAKESAEENDRLKSSFLANMSHELRTPLSGILGFSNILKEQLKDEDNIEMADMINKSGNRLLNTLNLILDLSQIEANVQKVHCQTFDLNDCLYTCVKLFTPIATKKGLELVYNYSNSDFYIYSDRAMLEHVINELISNAIKYTPKGSVSVTAGIKDINNESRIAIEVIDTGIGISSEYYDSIFDAFRQVSEGWNRNFEGTGLGLTICKKYVNLLDGDIALESNAGSGCRFILSFQVSMLRNPQITRAMKEVKIHTATKDPYAKSSALPEILLVDDDECCNILVTKLLINHARITYAHNGDECLSLLEKRSFDIILLDINLKVGLSGPDVLDKIKHMPKFQNIPVIALTAYAMLKDREHFISLGFSDYISKPFTNIDLIDAIDKWKEKNSSIIT